MVSQSGVVSFPVPAYSNPPITPQFYQPSRFVISEITFGVTTTVSSLSDMNFVIGQLVRLLIAPVYGSYQLNEVQGYVLSIPTTKSVVIDINSIGVTAFIANPYTSTITAATKASHVVLTANNSFYANNLLTISGVQGMTELNGSNRLIVSRTDTTITLDLNSTAFGTYTSGGIATLQTPIVNYPQIIAVGDVNSGQTNTGRTGNLTFVPGSFINISPL